MISVDPKRPIRLLGCALAALLAVGALGCFNKGVTPIRTHFNKGVYHHSTGDYRLAISEYRLALEEDPSDFRARFNLASSQEALADELEAAGMEEEAREHREIAEEHYRRILDAHPENLRAAVNLAAREIESGREDAGRERLERSIAEHPRSPLPKIALAAHALRRSGDDPGEVRRSIGLLEEAHELDPARVETNMLLGRAYSILTRLEPEAGEHLGNARSAYARALEKDPHDLATLLAAARLELGAGDAARAELFLRRALYVAPHHLEAHLLMADAQEAVDDLQEATLHLWKARELEDPENPRLAPEDYENRLLELYRRLEARETL